MRRWDDISDSSVFVDASAWLAFSNIRDQFHSIASAVVLRCFEDRTPLVTTNWTAFEALSMLKSRVGSQSAQDLWALINNPRAVILVQVDANIESRALSLFFAYGDKTWGIVDCASLIVMQDTGCQQAIGFDHHFVEASRQRGFQLLP